MLPDLPQTEAAIVEMTNVFRKANALQNVKPNATLAAAARAFAEYLAKSGRFSHEADGRKPEDRAIAQGYTYCLVAENLARNLNSRGYESRQLAREVVEGWKGSPGHRENLLLGDATETGVAVVRMPDKHPKFVSVQMFGRPESLKVTYSIQNQSAKTVHFKLGAEQDRVHARETVTYSDCTPRALNVDGPMRGPALFQPRNGDWFIIRTGSDRGITVDVKRK